MIIGSNVTAGWQLVPQGNSVCVGAFGKMSGSHCRRFRPSPHPLPLLLILPLFAVFLPFASVWKRKGNGCYAGYPCCGLLNQLQEYDFHIALKIFNSTFSAKPLSTWCIHNSHSFQMVPLYRAARIITSNHITRLRTTTKTPELIPSSGYLITGLLSGWLLFSCSSSFTSTSLSSLIYRIKMCYPHFNVFSTQKGLLHLLSLSLGSSFELSQSFSFYSTRREVWAAGKSMLSVAKAFSRHIKCPVKSIDFPTNFGTSLFQPQSNLPDSPRWGHIKNQITSYLPPPGERYLIKSLYMPLLSPYLSRVRGGVGVSID